jgi:hypothetical protein
MKNAWVFPQLSFLRMWRLERVSEKLKFYPLEFLKDDHTRAYAILNANEVVACKRPMSEQALISE